MKLPFLFRPGDSLNRQMLSILSFGLALLTVLLILINDHNIRQTAINKSFEEETSHAAFFATLIDSDVSQSLLSVSARAENLQRSGMVRDAAGLEEFLTTLQNTLPKYAWLGFADKFGNIRASSRGLLTGKDASMRPWFIEGQKKLAVVDVHDAQLLAKMLQEPEEKTPMRYVDLAAPVHDGKRQVVGVLAAHLSLAWLNERVNFYNKAINNAKEIDPFVLGHDGHFRFGNQAAFDGLQGLGNPWRNKPNSGHMLLEHQRWGKTLVAYTKHSSQGLPGEMGWVTVTLKPLSAVVAAATEQRLVSAGGVLLMALMVWLLMFQLLRWVNQPVKRLLAALEEAQTQESDIRELQGLPREFSKIRAEINRLLAALRERERQLRNALHQAKSSFHGVTGSFPGVLFSIEEQDDGHFEFSYLSDSVNEYFCLEGEPPKNARAFLAQVLADKSEAHIRQVEQRFAHTPPLDFVAEILGSDGDLRHMRFKGQPRALEHGKRAWDGIVIDVSNLIRAQQSALAADEAKSRFLATMSHEIRTPLNGILGFAQILYQEQTDPKSRQDVQKIIDTADTLTRILNDVLDFSKIEAGKIEIESRPFSFVELTNAVRDIFLAEAQQRSLEFSLSLSGQPGLTLLGDPTRLRQIVTNLVSNAMKFTSHGQVSLAVDVNEIDKHRAKVRLEVRDSGIGITQEHMQRLFKRFEQSDAATYRRYGGSGLGLAIVKGLVDSMGGCIEVGSKVGQGTRFTIDLDFAVVSSSALHETLAPSAVVRPLKILVVDDVDTNRDVICRGLKRDGHEFHQAVDGLQGLKLAQAKPFDLILMDLDMPIMDGYESTLEIRRQSQNQDTFIIALSGFAYDTDVAAVQKAGMNMHLAKPLSLRKLRDIMLEQFGEA